MTRSASFLAILATTYGLAFGDEPAPKPTWPGMTNAGTVILPNGWSLKPAGRQSRLGDFPVAIALHPSEPILAVLHAGYGEHEVVTINPSSGKVIGRVAISETFNGLVWSSDGRKLYAGGGWDDVIYAFDHSGGLLSNAIKIGYPSPRKEGGRRVPSGLALSKDGKTLWVANSFGHSIAKFESTPSSPLKFVAEWPLGDDSYPYGVAWDEAKARLYVSLWAKAEIAVVDTTKGEVVSRWKSEEHPNELLLARGGKTLYAANANRNTVSAFDTEAGKATELIGTAIDPRAPAGSTPNSLALTPDESVLFVANANTNNLAVVNVKEAGKSTPLGFIPTGWYPTSVRVSKDGRTLFVANGKGAGSKANRDGPMPLAHEGGDKTREYIASLLQGTLSTIPMPGPREIAAYAKTVYECSPLRKENPLGVTGSAPRQEIRFQRRWATGPPSRIASTSSRRTEPTTRFSATSTEPTASPSFASFPRLSRRTIMHWSRSSWSSTTSTPMER